MTQLSIIARKTKAEILSEYEKLLRDLEETKEEAKTAYNPQSAEVIKKVGEQFAGDAIAQSIAKLKTTINDNLSETSSKINDSLNVLLKRVITEAEKFSDLQKAVDISKSRLESQHNIKLLAETIDKLAEEFEKKRRELEQENYKKTQELNLEMEDKKRDWKREQEEHEYDLKLKRGREAAIFEENKVKKERELTQREEAIKTQEEEVKKLRSQIEEMPKVIEKQVTIREQEIVKKLDAEHKNTAESAKKDWEAEKKLLEIRIKTFEDSNKKQEAEMVQLKRETELANKKVQELAVKAIESGSLIGKKVNDESNNSK